MPDLDGFSGRGKHFHSLPASKVVAGAPTATDALILAGLDWTVALSPTHQKIGEEYREVPGHFLTVRNDTNAVLGAVGKQYAPFQNADAFAFADELLGYGVEFDSAGHWQNGAQVFLTAHLPSGIKVEGEEDLDLYLVLRNSHNGSCAITAMITPIRLSCTNMLNLAMREAVSSIKIRHTRTASDRAQEAATTLKLVDQYRIEMESITADLLATEVNLEGFEKLVSELTDSVRVQDTMHETWGSSPTVDRKTGWGALNAIGEALEYFPARTTGVESRFASNLDGPIARTRSRAAQLLLRR